MPKKKQTQREISKAYNDALEAAIRKNRDYFRKLRDIERGVIKPPAAYTTQKQIEAWTQGYMRRMMKQSGVVDSIAAEMQQAGVQVRKGIQSSMVTLYKNNREITTRMLDRVVPAHLPEMSKREIEVLLYGQGNQSAFSKIAMNRLQSDTVIKRRLRREFVQSIQNGESEEQLLQRIRKVTGREMGDAKRILRTESTHIDSMAQQQAALDHWHETGVKPYKRWICQFHNSRESHIAMHRQMVPADQDFTLPSGAPISYPGDSRAGAAEVCNCQCRMEIVAGKAAKQMPETAEQADEKSLKSNGENGIISVEEGLKKQFKSGPLRKGQKFITPDGDVASFEGWVKGKKAEVIAGKGRKRQIDEIDNLLHYGGSADSWQKVKRLAEIAVENQETGEKEYGVVDLHWYEDPTVGIVKRKVKYDESTGWWFYDIGEMPY